MNPLQSVDIWLTRQGWGKIEQSQPVYGGSICNCYHAVTESKKEIFIKAHGHPPANFFKAEAAGLGAIAETKTITTPHIYHRAQDFLVMEYIKPGEKTNHYWENFGRSLAAMHLQQVPSFGFIMDNFCGLTAQPNPICDDGYRFFSEHRILYQAKLALDNLRLPAYIAADIERLCEKLPELIPYQPASLLHGDLWYGNTYCKVDGDPVLIDPACSWGWAEGEIAMTHLFGSFPECFYQAYCEQNPLLPDFNQRIPIYNLYHILNHLNLFGKSYLGQVTKILKCYI